MAQEKALFDLIIPEYQRQLEKMGIHCEKVLLYGSYAQGKQQEGSDIDLVVISDDWKKYSRLERLELLGIAAARILQPIQAVGFTPEEIRGEDILPFWQEIIRTAAHAA